MSVDASLMLMQERGPVLNPKPLLLLVSVLYPTVVMCLPLVVLWQPQGGMEQSLGALGGIWVAFVS